MLYLSFTRQNTVRRHRGSVCLPSKGREILKAPPPLPPPPTPRSAKSCGISPQPLPSVLASRHARERNSTMYGSAAQGCSCPSTN